MNILISTTHGWNIGDEFIRFGVQYLLEQAFDNITYIYYDRNPDMFVDGLRDWDMGSGHYSNIMNNPIAWDAIDMVVLAGSPEWLHGPLKPIYEGLKENPHIPLLALGVGYGIPNCKPSSLELEVLKRPNTLIITRQEDLAVRLTELLDKPIKVLPCPAYFCSHYLQKSYKIEDTDSPEPDTLALIIQIPDGKHPISQSLYDSCMTAIKNYDRVIVHNIDEFIHFKRLGIDVFYNPCPIQTLMEISKYESVHSTRLHGFFAAKSFSNHAVLLSDSDHRVESAAKTLYSYKGNLTRDYVLALQDWKKSL